MVERPCKTCGEVFQARGFRSPFGGLWGVATVCPACADAAERRAKEQAEAEARERAERLRAEREASLMDLIRKAGANPWAHGRCTFDNYDASESGTRPLEAVREFLADVRRAGQYDPVRGLYLFGDTGCGKTHLAVAAMRKLLSDPEFPERGVIFDHALSLINKIQDTYNTGESTEAIVRQRVRARVWILDDLGTEKASDDVVRRLTAIFAEREGRPTLVTSNIAPDALEKRHPEYFRLQSRLGPAQFRTVPVRGRDRRFDRPRKEEAA